MNVTDAITRQNEIAEKIRALPELEDKETVARALTLLAEALDCQQVIEDSYAKARVPDNLFSWDYNSILHAAVRPSRDTGHFCGTAGCALGLYAIMSLHPGQKSLPANIDPMTSPAYEYFSELRWHARDLAADLRIAVNGAFGTSKTEVIFYGDLMTVPPMEDVTPNMVARSIRHLLETGEAVPYAKREVTA